MIISGTEEIFRKDRPCDCKNCSCKTEKAPGGTNFLNPEKNLEVREEIVLDGIDLRRKGQPVYTGVLKYFPDAIKYIGHVSLVGGKQYGQDETNIFWDRDNTSVNEDALVRHLIDHSKNPKDTDGVYHLGKVAWRALAALQEMLEENKFS